MLKNISKREKIILAVCLLLLSAYFIFNFIFVPINRKINDLSSEIAVKELELKKSYKILSLKQGQDEEFKKYSDIVDLRRGFGGEQKTEAEIKKSIDNLF